MYWLRGLTRIPMVNHKIPWSLRRTRLHWWSYFGPCQTGRRGPPGEASARARTAVTSSWGHSARTPSSVPWSGGGRPRHWRIRHVWPWTAVWPHWSLWGLVKTDEERTCPSEIEKNRKLKLSHRYILITIILMYGLTFCQQLLKV